MLLAHSRSAGVCEPITVILAEVEGPELAAILGLIYTGNAAIARPRLDAFLRAAQTLRVKLPPLPEMMTCTEDCKPEDVKDCKPEDVKFNPTYLHCDQYPPLSYRGWQQEHEQNVVPYKPYDVPQTRDLRALESSRSLKMYPRDQKTDHSIQEKTIQVDDGQLKRPEKLDTSANARYGLCPQRDPDPNQKMKNLIEVGPVSPRTMDLKKRRVENVPTPIDGCPKATAMDLCKIPRNVSDHCRPPVEVDGGHRGFRLGERRMDGENTVDNCSVNYSTPRLFTAVETPPLRTMHSGDIRRPPPPSDKERFPLLTTDARLNAEKNFEPPSNCLENLFDLRVPSLHQTLHIESTTVEKFSYVQDEQTSTCRESCCRWRPPRKHVANHVTASPWRQLTRPHPSPKVQPMLQQNHHEDCVSQFFLNIFQLTLSLFLYGICKRVCSTIIWYMKKCR